MAARSIFLHLLAFACATCLARSAQAQGLAEHIHRFKVSGITSTMLEKQTMEALLAFDPEMVVSIDRPYETVKVKTMHVLPLAELVGAMQQLGLAAVLVQKTATPQVQHQQ